jgi:predicted ester cyclase
VAWSARGTNTVQGLGFKPTGRKFSVNDKSVLLIKNGKIVEYWSSDDLKALLQQLGVPKIP